MTTIQQLMQTGPTQANAIFAKLLDSSAAGVKARDQLFSDLKGELDRQAEFEEQRLFPMLRKHKDTKDLVAGALNNNQQMRKLLGELEGTPKDSEAFAAKVTSLRDLSEGHLRDDKKELLPAIVKALSNEQASGKSEGENVEVTPARRADGGERHQREDEHETASAARQSADIVKAGLDAAQRGAEMARMATGAVTNPDRDARLDPSREEAPGTARGADTAAVGRSMVALLNEQARHALQAQSVMSAGGARTLAEIAQVQSAFIAGSFQRMGQFNDSYLAFIRGWRGFSFAPSSHR